ncbi:MAG: hypothetical protein HC822_20340 [Oscillochloris sp.]|nr:hypothetical protein [Oscillochloris sp.]
MTNGDAFVVQPGVALAPGLLVDRAERNRLVIFDPTSVALLRPVIVAEDVYAWFCAPADRWAIVIRPDYSRDLSTLNARHPALARHISAAGLADPAQWEVAAPILPPGPRIILAPQGAAAWDAGTALVAAPAHVIPAAEPHWLAFLRNNRRELDHSGDATKRPAIPPLPAPTRANLDGLVLSVSNLARQRAELEQAVLRRLLADFAPPGVGPSGQLAHWWELDFDALREEVLTALQNDIPQRFRATWRQIHHDQRNIHADATARIQALEAAITAQVAAVVGGV